MTPRDEWEDFDFFEPEEAAPFDGNDEADIFDDEPFSDEDDAEFIEELNRATEEVLAETELEAQSAPWDDEDEWEENQSWSPAPETRARCPHCGTDWEQIRRDGRVGCASCYAVFRPSLGDIMMRMQRDDQHVGKLPRAARKRRLRLEHLRQRRDNQLVVLQSRLSEAVQSERYEEAARLRDKIKVVSASIFTEE